MRFLICVLAVLLFTTQAEAGLFRRAKAQPAVQKEAAAQKATQKAAVQKGAAEKGKHFRFRLFRRRAVCSDCCCD